MPQTIQQSSVLRHAQTVVKINAQPVLETILDHVFTFDTNLNISRVENELTSCWVSLIQNSYTMLARERPPVCTSLVGAVRAFCYVIYAKTVDTALQLDASEKGPAASSERTKRQNTTGSKATLPSQWNVIETENHPSVYNQLVVDIVSWLTIYKCRISNKYVVLWSSLWNSYCMHFNFSNACVREMW